MNENKIRKLLNEGKPTTCTRIWSTWSFFTEALGATGNFDYMEFAAEYAPYSQVDLENIARAAELHNMGTMIKLDFMNRGFTAQKAIASGFQAILFVDHETPAEVKESIKMIKPNTPSDKGLYGTPQRRFIGTRPNVSQTEHAQRLRDIVICFMIESEEAMKNIDEICSIEGVDMLQFGPSDYSLSVGWNRNEHIEELKAEERKMIDVALKHGIQPRCEIKKVEAAQYYIDLGVRHFSLGDQFDKINQFWKEEGARIRKIADELK
ncbi:aldolase/citrate lyase family protein [Treponema primitia]|uniref:aldolase/citrate lyase family protein n=1 Tax=Treponema primitia TaxID=88058 RepID=UPI00397FB8A3